MAGELRLLIPGDEPALFTFLERHVDSSLFFFSNVAKAGLVDRGEHLQGTYVAHFAGGEMTAVAGHAWNGNVMVQGDEGLESAVARAVVKSGRPVKGFVGPLALVRRARYALGLEKKEAIHDGEEILFALDLERLRIPPRLADPKVVCRTPTDAEIEEPLTPWRVAYHVETLGSRRSPELHGEARALLTRLREARSSWVLVDEGRLVSFTAFNAEARGIVQVGGVWTPPELRGRGYARAAVAGSLLSARHAGATRSVLFTAETNIAAIRAYRALGYEAVGDWCLVLFR